MTEQNESIIETLRNLLPNVDKVMSERFAPWPNFFCNEYACKKAYDTFRAEIEGEIDKLVKREEKQDALLRHMRYQRIEISNSFDEDGNISWLATTETSSPLAVGRALFSKGKTIEEALSQLIEKYRVRFIEDATTLREQANALLKDIWGGVMEKSSEIEQLKSERDAAICERDEARQQVSCGIASDDPAACGNCIRCLENKVSILQTQSRLWYKADGTYEKLDPDEVIRLRKVAAVEIADLRKRLQEEERTHNRTIDERDFRERQITEVARSLGVTSEWSNLHDLGEEAKEVALALVSENICLRKKLEEAKKTCASIGMKPGEELPELTESEDKATKTAGLSALKLFHENIDLRSHNARLVEALRKCLDWIETDHERWSQDSSGNLIPVGCSVDNCDQCDLITRTRSLIADSPTPQPCELCEGSGVVRQCDDCGRYHHRDMPSCFNAEGNDDCDGTLRDTICPLCAKKSSGASPQPCERCRKKDALLLRAMRMIDGYVDNSEASMLVEEIAVSLSPEQTKGGAEGKE